VVTANLRDGPPEDAHGRRIFQRVLWCHPEVFATMLTRWAEDPAFATTFSGDLAADFRALLDLHDAARS
jgi:hypothetical protein